MFENFGRLFRKISKTEIKELDVVSKESKETAKERLHMVLMQDRANVSADFLELMKQEIIDVIKKYIEVDEEKIDVRLTTQTAEDGTIGMPSLYANIPILNIRNDMKVENYKFALQSDGTIIAHKIEEELEEIELMDKLEEINTEIDDTKHNEEESEKNVIGIDEENSEKIENKDEVHSEENLEEKNKSENTLEDEIEFNESENDKSEEIKSNEENSEKEEVEFIETENKMNEQEDKKTIDSDEIPIENLKKSSKRGRPRKKDKVEKEKKKVEEKKNEEEKIEEDDDDVTFDDLLKAAEEEDRKLEEQKNNGDK